MRFNFWFGVSVVCFGLLACLVEICLEPWLLKRSHWIQIAFFTVWLIMVDIFAIDVVLRDNPLYIGYRITDTKLVELYIRNDSELDYQDMDLAISTDAQNAYFNKLRNLSDFPSLTVVDQGWKLTYMQAALIYSDGVQYHITRPTVRVRCAMLPHHSSSDALLSIVRGSGGSGIVPAMDWHTLKIKGNFTGKFFKSVQVSRNAIREN
jgi:hypothetical protein